MLFRSEGQAQLASASDDKTIILYNMQTYRQEAILKGHNSEIKNCIFLGDIGCIVSSDVNGYLKFWSVRPCKVRYKLLTTIHNEFINEEKKLDFSLIKSMCFDSEKCWLYTGDELGVVRIWNCEDLCKVVKDLQPSSIHADKAEDKTFMTESKTAKGIIQNY